MTLREAIAAALAVEGVDTVFGLMGDGNMHLIYDLVERHGVRFINTRQETAAVLMADGYARVSGRIGVATVTYGPGLAAAALGLGIAAAARASVLVVVGDTPRADPLHVHSFEQEIFVHGLGVTILSISYCRRCDAYPATGDSDATHRRWPRGREHRRRRPG